MADTSDYYLGFSFGNTNCCVDYFCDDQMVPVVDENESKTTPTILTFTDEEYLIGQPAIDVQSQQEKAAKNTVTNLKKFFGSYYSDSHVQEAMKLSKCTVKQSANAMVTFEVEYKNKRQRYSPEDIFALILRQLQKNVEAAININVKNCIVPVPMSASVEFQDTMRNAVKAANLNLVDIVQEPVACCYAYELFRPGDDKKTVFIFDFGGSSCEVTLLNITSTKYMLIATKKEAIGGDNIDQLIMANILQKNPQFKESSMTEDQKSTLLNECIKAKLQLSMGNMAILRVDRLDGKNNLRGNITGSEFSSIIDPIINQCKNLITSLFSSSKTNPSQVNYVILAGGSSHLPQISALMSKTFPTSTILDNIDPSEVVAAGAAYKAAIVFHPELLEKLSDTPFGETTSIQYTILNPHSDSDEGDD